MMQLPSILFIFAVSVIAAACEQISPPPPVAGGPPPGPGPVVSSACTPSMAAQAFVARQVFMLNPNASTPPYQPQREFKAPPSADVTRIDPNSVYAKDIGCAYDIAPEQFQHELNGLTKIFVEQCTGTDCGADATFNGSWGMRAYNDRPPARYIAISTALWQNGLPLTLDEYSSDELKLLLKKLAGAGTDVAGWPNPPWDHPWGDDENSAAASVLAALAHETGHVLWFDTFVRKPGGPIDQNAPESFCGGQFYRIGTGLYSWTGVAVPPNRWLMFGQQNFQNFGKQYKTVRYQPEKYNPDYIGMLKDDLDHPRPDFHNADIHLNQLRADPSLASLLAAVSPVEDFVETYELFVLLNVRPSTPHNLNSRKELLNRKRILLNKINCFLRSRPAK
jgi:hypothetical protein